MISPDNASIAKLSSKFFVWNPESAETDKDIWQRVVLEFEAALVGVTAQNNSKFLMGLAQTNGERSDDNVLGFSLVSDALNTLTDKAGTETENVVSSPPTLTAYNRYKIVLSNGSVEFYVNGALVDTIITNIPAIPLKAAFVLISDNSGSAELRVGATRLYLLD